MKKGTTMVTVVLIVAAVVLIGWLVFLGIFKIAAERGAEGDVCRLTVLAAAKTKTPLIKTASSFNLKCPIENIGSNAETKEEVYLELATAMTQCWVNYGKGKLDYYSNWEWGPATTHCRICSKINFEKKDIAVTYAEFGNYLNTQEIPLQKKTFAEFFTDAENSQILLGADEGIAQSQVINIAEPSYVVFRVEKRNQEIQDIKDAFTAMETVDKGAAGAGILIGNKKLNELMGASVESFTKEALEKAGIKIVHSNGNILYGAAAKTALEKGSAKAVSTTASAIAKKFAGTAVKVGSKLVPGVVKKIGSKAVPVIGWGLLVYDVATLAGKADQFNPSLAVYSAQDIQGICEDLN